jgi:hypothetical protein
LVDTEVSSRDYMSHPMQLVLTLKPGLLLRWRAARARRIAARAIYGEG